MARWKRLALGLLVAYAASMTLYAARASAEVFVFRRVFGQGDPLRQSRLLSPDYLTRLARDYGADLTHAEAWALRVADLQGLLLFPLICVFVLLGLGAGLLPSRSRSDHGARGR